MADDHSRTVQALVEAVEAQSARQADEIEALTASIERAISSDVDPCTTGRVLVEGLVEVIAQRVPRRGQEIVAVRLLKILFERLRETGIVAT